MGVLRILLALSVVLEHSTGAPTTLVGGVVAVQAFFILSGFYMALVLSEKYAAVGPFYSNRALRIFPTYLLVLIVSIASDRGAKLANIITSAWGAPSKMLMIFANFGVFGSDAMMFTAPIDGRLTFVQNFWANSQMFWKFHYIPQAWTLPLELSFYLIAPFIVRRIPALLAICIASLGIRLLLYFYGLKSDPWNYRFFPSELMFFCAGSLAFHVYAGSTFREFYRPRLGLIARAVIVALIAVFPIAVGFMPSQAMQLMFYVCLLILLPFLFSSSKQSKYDRFVGELSYPLYICHFVITTNADHLPVIFGALGSTIFFCIAAAVLIHFAFEIWIEKIFHVDPKILAKHSS